MSALSARKRPGRTPQRMRALHRANSARTAGADTKRRLAELGRREATLEVARLLFEDADSIGVVKIYTLLTAIPKMGDVKARRILQDRSTGFYIWPFRRVDELTDRQRTRIVGELTVMASRVRVRP